MRLNSSGLTRLGWNCRTTHQNHSNGTPQALISFGLGPSCLSEMLLTVAGSLREEVGEEEETEEGREGEGGVE